MTVGNGGKGRRGLWLGGALLGAAALVAGFAAFLGKTGEEQLGGAAAEPKPVASSSAAPSELGKLSAEQLKAAIAALHPGMELPDDVLEQAIDPSQLPLTERKERIAKGIAEHKTKERDKGWAMEHEKVLTSRFNEVAVESVYTVDDIECRWTTCVVKLHWPTAEVGDIVYEKLTTTPVAFGCQLEMVPPEAGEVKAALFLDCAKGKEQMAASAPIVQEDEPPPPRVVTAEQKL